MSVVMFGDGTRRQPGLFLKGWKTWALPWAITMMMGCEAESKKIDPLICGAPYKNISLAPYPNCKAWLEKRCGCLETGAEAVSHCKKQISRGETCGLSESDFDRMEPFCQEDVEAGSDVCAEWDCQVLRRISLNAIPNCKSVQEQRCRCPDLGRAPGEKERCEVLTAKGVDCLPPDRTPEEYDAECKAVLEVFSSLCPLTLKSQVGGRAREFVPGGG